MNGNTKSGLVRVGPQGPLGFFIALEDLGEIDNLIINLAVDSGTQPAYARGLVRALGAIRAVMNGEDAKKAMKSGDSYTTEQLDALRRKQKEYQ